MLQVGDAAVDAAVSEGALWMQLWDGAAVWDNPPWSPWRTLEGPNWREGGHVVPTDAWKNIWFRAHDSHWSIFDQNVGPKWPRNAILSNENIYPIRAFWSSRAQLSKRILQDVPHMTDVDDVLPGFRPSTCPPSPFLVRISGLWPPYGCY